MMQQFMSLAMGFLADLVSPKGQHLQKVKQHQKQREEACSARYKKKPVKEKKQDRPNDDENKATEKKVAVPESQKNWECMPANARELLIVTNQRVKTMKNTALQSLAKVQTGKNSIQLRRLSKLVEQRVAAEMPVIEGCRQMMRKDPLPGGYRFQGSVREVWGFQDTSDIDLVLTKKRPSGLEVINIVPGFCQFRRPSTVVKICRRHGSSELFRPGRRFTDASATSKILSPGKFRKKFSDWRLANSNMLLSQGKLEPGARSKIREHGPAVTHDHCFIVAGREERREVDFVCTLVLRSRPWLLKEWEFRQADSTIGFSRQVQKARVHVVPIGAYSGPTKQGSHTWRYSYNEIECRLIEELSPELGGGYALLKKVCHRYLKPAGIKSYHAKTCYLWLLLQLSTMAPSMLELVEAAVELLLTCAADGFIPNYFMPCENILREEISINKVNREAISTYLENFAESGERITDLTVARLRSYIEQLAADIAITPPPSLLNWSDSCLCSYSDVADRQYCCDSDDGSELTDVDQRERANKQCTNCDSLTQYELKKPKPFFLFFPFSRLVLPS